MGDEYLYDPSSFENYKMFQGPLTRGAWEEADRAFHQAYLRSLQAPFLELPHEALNLPLELTHDVRGLWMSPKVIPEQVLCDLVEDFCPDGPMIAPDRFVGPWADLWRRDLIRLSVAGAAWWPWLSGPGSPVQRYLNSKPRPDLDERRAVKSVGLAPPMLYDLDWKPLLPLHKSYLLPPPTLGTIVPLTEAPPAGYVARLVPTEQGTMAFCALALPALPPVEVLRQRLHNELLRLRRHERRVNWETLLRDRGEVLYRLTASFCWETS